MVKVSHGFYCYKRIHQTNQPQGVTVPGSYQPMVLLPLHWFIGQKIYWKPLFLQPLIFWSMIVILEKWWWFVGCSGGISILARHKTWISRLDSHPLVWLNMTICWNHHAPQFWNHQPLNFWWINQDACLLTLSSNTEQQVWFVHGLVSKSGALLVLCFSNLMP